MSADEPIRLVAGHAEARIARRGAEPVSWRVGGRELIWSADPAHWARHAPLLFPVVGACVGGVVRVDGREFPMPQHGFARDAEFEVVASGPSSARLRLTDSEATRARYPFPFRLDVTATLTRSSLALAFEVTNPGPAPLPYALGVHPAFPWPFDGTSPEDHAVAFGEAEAPEVPGLTRDGLLAPGRRALAFDGRLLPLTPGLFADGALLFLGARSHGLRFVAPSGASITLDGEGLPHLALWTKPGAPFLSLEAWSGHAEPDGLPRDLRDRAGIGLLAPGALARHAARMTWTPPG